MPCSDRYCKGTFIDSNIKAAKIDLEELLTKAEVYLKQFYLNKNPPHFIRRLNEFKYNITSNEAEICMKNIKYRAEITFRLAANTLTVTVMSRRLSLFDKVSAFGKIC